MSWTDEDIDKVFGEAADVQKFEYRPEYWKDIEKQLPINKSKKPVFWWITGTLFLVGFMSLFFTDINTVSTHNVTADVNEIRIKNTNLDTQKSSTNNLNSTSVVNESKEEVENSNTISQSDGSFSSGKATKNQNTYPKNNNAGKAVSLPVLDNKLSDLQLNSGNLVSESNNKVDLNYNELAKPNSGEIISTEATANSDNEVVKVDKLPFLAIDNNIISAELLAGKDHGIKISKTRMFVEINGGLGQAWTRSESNNNSVNASLGFSSGIILPINKFSLSVGLGFQSTILDELKIKERTKVYGFGSNIIENTYKFNSMNSLTLPVSIAYGVGRHSFSFGLKPSINLFTRLLRTQSIDENQTMYSKGVANVSLFNRFGLQPNIGYDYYVNEKTQIGVRANIQLLQIIQSDRFIGTPVKMPFEAQFYLKRTINF